MTYKDLLDTLVIDAGDTGTTYRINAMRWLNLARQDSVARGSWKSAKNASGSFTTDAGNTSGIYTLIGIDEVIGGELYDTTHHNVINRDTDNVLQRMDVGLDETGPPVLWSDAGMSSAGEKQIRLWPVPLEAIEIVYTGTKALTDITENQELLTVDPYFGPLTACGSMLQAGLRFYHDLNNNEDVSTIGRSQTTFYKMISLVSSQAGIDANTSTRLDPVNRVMGYSGRGRFDPGHYGNR